MNLIETIYCSQYYELKKSGREPMKGRLNGTLLSATVILLAMVPIIVVVNCLAPGNSVAHFVRGVGDSGLSGRAIGKIIGLAGILVVGGFLNFTYGSEKRYRAMMVVWEGLPEDELAQTVKTSLKIFGIVFGIFLLIIIGGFF